MITTEAEGFALLARELERHASGCHEYARPMADFATPYMCDIVGAYPASSLRVFSLRGRVAGQTCKKMIARVRDVMGDHYGWCEMDPDTIHDQYGPRILAAYFLSYEAAEAIA